MFVQDGFLYLIVNKHKLTVSIPRVPQYLSPPPPNPSPQASVSPPEPKEGHTRLRVRGWGGPNLDDLASMARVYFRMKYKYYKRRKL
jgi:hypothetical protein